MRNKPQVGWGEFVRMHRERASMTRPALADRIGTDRTTIWRWETKDQKPDNFAQVVRLAKVLRVERSEALAAAGWSDHYIPETWYEPTAADRARARLLRRLEDARATEEEIALIHAFLDAVERRRKEAS